MRFFLDNNETPAILPVLKLVYINHTFRTAAEERLQDYEDIPLFHKLRRRRFDAIITRDKNQLADPDECRALVDCGLHWIGHKEPDAEGLNIITSLTAGYLAAFPHILDALDGSAEPLSCRVSAIPKQLTQRVRINPIPHH